MTISKDLLEILACPKCKGDLVLVEKRGHPKSRETFWGASEEGLVCERCKLLYPIRDGIPVMLIDESIPVG
jgi:uncharacterized protein YbaR (Trm112 family)